MSCTKLKWERKWSRILLCLESGNRHSEWLIANLPWAPVSLGRRWRPVWLPSHHLYNQTLQGGTSKRRRQHHYVPLRIQTWRNSSRRTWCLNLATARSWWQEAKHFWPLVCSTGRRCYQKMALGRKVHYPSRHGGSRNLSDVSHYLLGKAKFVVQKFPNESPL